MTDRGRLFGFDPSQENVIESLTESFGTLNQITTMSVVSKMGHAFNPCTIFALISSKINQLSRVRKRQAKSTGLASCLLLS